VLVSVIGIVATHLRFDGPRRAAAFLGALAALLTVTGVFRVTQVYSHPGDWVRPRTAFYILQATMEARVPRFSSL
jgi:hypothetical protein